MTTMYALRNILGKLEVRYFVSQQFGPTPDSRPLICMNDDQNDAGYNSNGAICPLFDAVRDEPPLHGPDEEEI